MMICCGWISGGSALLSLYEIPRNGEDLVVTISDIEIQGG